ncbi:MAG: Tim44-like domain-containing protein [Rhodoferax sp.]|nr:Tim44-like domain-containing protein [Rhodoferax sp.]
MKYWSLILVAALALSSLNAEAARRLGGGRSFGQQSGNVTQREAARAPVTPGGATQNAANAAPGAAAANGAAQAPRKPWGGMLGGLAAGMGLAWLAHSLGLGAAFGQILLLALVLLIGLAVYGMVVRSRRAAASSQGPYALQGAGSAPAAVTLRQYSPDNVGNDASARPWERTGMVLDPDKSQDGAAALPGPGSLIGSALAGSKTWGVPPGFDVDGFLVAAKRNFVTLQDAWDRADIGMLRTMMTDAMLGEIKTQLSEREVHTGGQSNRTDVVMLQAQLLGIEDLSEGYLASVEFSGMIREDPSAGPSPFREVWNMSKPKSGSSGWLVAGVQALQ